MSSTSRKLCKLILNEVFGDIVSSIGDKLHKWNGQTLQQLMLPPRINRTQDALAVLINHNIVSFKECPRTGKVIYVLIEDRVLALIKFPRYLIMTKTLFGDEGELIVEDFFKLGQTSMSSVIFKSARRLRLAKKSSQDFSETSSETITVLRKKFTELANCQFICRIPTPYTIDNPDPKMAVIPALETVESDVFSVPDMDFKAVKEALDKAEEAAEEDDDTELDLNNFESKILWRINYERFKREIRDQVVVQAVTKRIDSSAGNLMRMLLNIMNENSPWAHVSCHIRCNEVLAKLENIEDKRLEDFHDQYLKVLEEDRTRFIDKVGDAGGGQYVINAKHIFEELAAATAENIILERFGSKALRIFRVVRQKLHVEEAQLQNLVMIPAKETKHLTYTLMESNFIKLQELRKSMAANNTMGKSFFLFYVDLPQVARMVVEHCQKAIANSYIRKSHESDSNLRLLDKHERIESIVANLKSSEDLEKSEELQLQLQEVQDMVATLNDVNCCLQIVNHLSF